MNGQVNPLVLPVPTLDHVVVNVRDNMGDASSLFRRLGFTLTPLGRHTLGSINHLAMFGTDYLELIGVPPEGAPGTDVLDWPEGLNGLVFGTDDSEALFAALSRAGAPVLPPLAFSRPVALPDGPREAAFRTVRVERAATAAGRMYFCQHLTRDVVWRDEWRRHANGVVGVAAMVIGADDPSRSAGLFRALFGADAVVARGAGVRLCAGLTDIDVLPWPQVRERFGAQAPDPAGRAEAMAGLVLRTMDVGRAEAALRHGGIAAHRADPFAVRVAVLGLALEFRAA